MQTRWTAGECSRRINQPKYVDKQYLKILRDRRMAYTIQPSTRNRTDTHEQSVDIGYTVRRCRSTPKDGTAYQRRDNKVGIVQYEKVAGRKDSHNKATKRSSPFAAYTVIINQAKSPRRKFEKGERAKKERRTHRSSWPKQNHL